MKALLLLAAMAIPIHAKPEAKIFKSADGSEIPYRFSAPDKTVEGERYPLVLFLHGAGERGSNNRSQLRNGVKDILKGAESLGQPVYLIAPQCPANQWWAEPKPDLLTLKDAGGKNPLLEAVMALVEETAKNFPVDSKRIYATGLSMGGFGTWDLLARSPGTWAAAVPICGAGDPDSVGNFKHVPIRIFHGAKDDVVPPQGSKLMADALKKTGGDAKLYLYEGVGHDSWSNTYRDPELIKWLFAQRKND